MKLHENQLHLIRHLCRFHMLSYADCLWLLDTEEANDPVALSYAFRPLTKNGYLSKRKDGSVTISAKGRALFPDTKPLISMGGGKKERQRIMTVSRVAALLPGRASQVLLSCWIGKLLILSPLPVGERLHRVFCPPPGLPGC